jgi:hypothetical protein
MVSFKRWFLPAAAEPGAGAERPRAPLSGTRRALRVGARSALALGVNKAEAAVNCRPILITVGATLLAGCASNPPITSLSSEQRQRVAEMVILPSGSIPSDAYRLLGTVQGLACKRNLYASGKPSLEEARQGVRIRAALLGADAVTNMVCEDKQEVDWGHNCWQAIVWVGDAITVTDRSLLPRPEPPSLQQ